MRYLFPLVATSAGGETRLIQDVAAFHAFVRGRVIVENFWLTARVWDWRADAYVARDTANDWIVRDDRGRKVLANSLGPAPVVPWRDLTRNRWRQFTYRRGPVPGIHGLCHQRHDAPRKRHGGRGVAARTRLLHSGPPLDEPY